MKDVQLVLHITAACFFSLQSDISSFAQFWRSWIEGGKIVTWEISLSLVKGCIYILEKQNLYKLPIFRQICFHTVDTVYQHFSSGVYDIYWCSLSLRISRKPRWRCYAMWWGIMYQTWVGAKVNSLGWEKWKEVSIPRQYNLQGQPLKIDQRKTGSPTDRANFTKLFSKALLVKNFLKIRLVNSFLEMLKLQCWFHHHSLISHTQHRTTK